MPLGGSGPPGPMRITMPPPGAPPALTRRSGWSPLNPVALGAGPFATVGSNITFAGLVTVSTNTWLVGNTVTLAGGVTGGAAGVGVVAACSAARRPSRRRA